jgi:Mg2+ and Co2+ transporter CorA
MTSETGIERRVSRLENEVVAIFDLIRDETAQIKGVLAEHSQILAEHTQILAEHTHTLAEHGQALAEILRRLPEPA